MDTSIRSALALLPAPAAEDVSGPSDAVNGRIGDARPTTRERMLELTMREVARVGPAAFNTRTVCGELGIAHPMVHYHFGSRDGLIAEAAHVLYARYVDLLWVAVEAAPRAPIERLRAFLATGVRFSVEMRGWGAVLNYYPYYSNAVAGIVAERFQAQHTQLYAHNLAMAAQLVADVWQDRITADAPAAPMVPADSAAALETPPELAAVAGLMFSIHGLTVWRAGHVVAIDGHANVEESADRVVADHLENLVTLIVASRPSTLPSTGPSQEER
jgi:AcrR family transcriptional regulator